MYTLEELKQEIVKQERVVEDAKNLLEHMGVLVEEMGEDVPWIPQEGDNIYWLDGEGDCHEFNSYNITCEKSWKQGNVFKTRKEAGQEAERREIMQELRMCEGVKDYSYITTNPFITLGNNTKKLKVVHNPYDCHMNQVYFKTEQDAKNAIEKIGEERLRKLFV